MDSHVQTIFERNRFRPGDFTSRAISALRSESFPKNGRLTGYLIRASHRMSRSVYIPSFYGCPHCRVISQTSRLDIWKKLSKATGKRPARMAHDSGRNAERAGPRHRFLCRDRGNWKVIASTVVVQSSGRERNNEIGPTNLFTIDRTHRRRADDGRKCTLGTSSFQGQEK